jgi:hypothetical protein
MLNSSRTSKQFFALFAAAAVVVAAELVSKGSEQTAITQTAIASEAVAAAPAEITGIRAPVVGYLSSLEDARIIVPELRAPALSAPALPDPELVVWDADDVIPAPTDVIEVDPPDLGFLPSLEDSGVRGRGLVRPPLSELRH